MRCADELTNMGDCEAKIAQMGRKPEGWSTSFAYMGKICKLKKGRYKCCGQPGDDDTIIDSSGLTDQVTMVHHWHT